MNQVVLLALAGHIFLGVAGVVTLGAYSLSISRQKLNLWNLKLYSLVGALTFILAWISGGYYYILYYGKTVKPIILRGHYPWAHTVLMEAKEHLFLFLPFLTITLFVITALGKTALEKDENLKKSVLRFVFVVVGLGITVALAGYMISGAVSK